jgi:hypothetical protein
MSCDVTEGSVMGGGVTETGMRGGRVIKGDIMEVL